MNKPDKHFLEKIRSKVGKAIADYQLIENNDKILVAISGGKDSMALLDILNNRKKALPITFELKAVHIQLTDVPYHTDEKYLQEFCNQRNIEFELITDDTSIIQEGKQPCFYCAWNRRKLLFEYAVKNRYKKVAFGHHRDDMIETLFINMIYHGELSSFPVKIDMFDGKLDIIRPLIYTSNAELKRYVQLINYKALPYDCPFAEFNQREKFGKLISDFHQLHPKASQNIFQALQNIDLKHLPIKPKTKS